MNLNKLTGISNWILLSSIAYLLAGPTGLALVAALFLTGTISSLAVRYALTKAAST